MGSAHNNDTVTNVTIETVHQSGPQPSIQAVSVHQMFWCTLVWCGVVVQGTQQFTFCGLDHMLITGRFPPSCAPPLQQ